MGRTCWLRTAAESPPSSCSTRNYRQIPSRLHQHPRGALTEEGDLHSATGPQQRHEVLHRVDLTIVSVHLCGLPQSPEHDVEPDPATAADARLPYQQPQLRRQLREQHRLLLRKSALLYVRAPGLLNGQGAFATLERPWRRLFPAEGTLGESIQEEHCRELGQVKPLSADAAVCVKIQAERLALYEDLELSRTFVLALRVYVG